MIFIGIDPGLSGAAVSVSSRYGHPPEIFLTPTISTGKKREYNLPEVKRWLKLWWFASQNGDEQIYATIEKQQAMPLQGRTSVFSIGGGFMLWKMGATMLDIPYTVVHPRTWKKEMLRDVPGTDQKGRSIIAAQRLFPDVSLLRTKRSRKPDHNIAEALLIMEYGRRIHA